MPVSPQHSRSAYKEGSAPKFHLHMSIGCRVSLLGDDPEIGNYFLKRRKEFVADREKWIVRQKEAAKDKQFELAKFCKQEANEAQKWYRAVCWLIPRFCATPLPGDCPERDFFEAPEELFPYLVHLENMASLQETSNA